MNLQDAQKKAIELINECGLTGWTFKFNNRTTSHGVCVHTKKQIQLSKITVPLRTEKAVINTIYHEIAHAMARVVYGGRIKPHGPEWKAIFIKLGGDGSTCSTDTVVINRTPKYHLINPDNTSAKRYYRKPNKKRYEALDDLYIVGNKADTLGKMRIVSHAKFEQLNYI